VLPLASCNACGLDAPIRASTRDGVVKWGVLMMVIQDGLVLWVMQSIHTGEGAIALTTVPLMTLSLTAFAVVLNLPRRLSHFVLGSCESEFMRKEELADDAKISMYAAQKIAFKASSPPPKEKPPSPPKPAPPPKRTPLPPPPQPPPPTVAPNGRPISSAARMADASKQASSQVTPKGGKGKPAATPKGAAKGSGKKSNDVRTGAEAANRRGDGREREREKSKGWRSELGRMKCSRSRL